MASINVVLLLLSVLAYAHTDVLVPPIAPQSWIHFRPQATLPHAVTINTYRANLRIPAYYLIPPPPPVAFAPQVPVAPPVPIAPPVPFGPSPFPAPVLPVG